jgi:iron complex outermembrane receptor protein
MKPTSAPFQPSAIVAALALLASAGVSAQTPSSAESAAGNDASKPEVVVVTAERRSENVKQVPSSVTAVSGARLEDIGAARIDDFVSLVPGLNFVGGRPGTRQLILRGISSGGDQQNATVGTYIDEVPIGSSTALNGGAKIKPDIDVFDLERLEVLRGPQGTLYGANSLGGLLKYVTVVPDAKRFSGFGRTEVMSVAHGGNGWGINAGLNVPLGETAALRVSAFYRTEPGYVDNLDPDIGRKDVNDLKTRGVRLSYAIRPTADFGIRLAALSQAFNTGGGPTEDVALATGLPVLGRYKQTRYTPEPSRQDFDLYSVTLDWNVAGGKLLSVTSYNKTKYQQQQDWTPYDGLGQVDPSVQLASETDRFGTRKTTQELRYTSPRSSRFEWMIGAFWTREESTLLLVERGLTSQGVVAPAPFDLLFLDDLRGTYTQKALYSNARYYVLPNFDIGVGLRLTRDSTRATDQLGGLFAGGSYNLEQSSSFTSFMLAPRYKIDDRTMVYARVANASRPGGPNSISPAGIAAGASKSFNPDKLTSYEAGVKTTSADGRFGLELSAFYIDWRDIQIRSTVNTFAYIGNGGKAKSQGLEASVAMQPVDGLSLGLNAALIDATLESDAAAVGGLKGDVLPNSPRFSASASADYEFAGIGASRAYVGAALRYLGERRENFVRGRSRERLSLPAFNTLDLRAGLRWNTWDLNFYVKNATDTHVVETLTTNFFPTAATIGRPRTAGAFVNMRY